MNPTLLIVDDDEDILSQMKWALARDYAVVLAGDRSSALQSFKSNQPLVVLLDLGLPPATGDTSEGFATLREILALDSHAKIIVATGQSQRENALSAIGQGAYDFLCKPVQVDELKIILRRAFEVAQLEKEYQQLQRQGRWNADSFEGMLGTSPKMLETFATIRKVATTDASVLIIGESGTGKEMVAQAIHRRSLRKDGPFVTINCGAIPEALLESELFGHEKGAFTGAHAQRAGRIEAAAHGTLFLDEIGDLPLALQVKLLRFLQEHTIERVGGRKTIQVDTRVIAATNVDLMQTVAAGKFREDLFYRLAVVVVKLPALRERPNDILLLAKGFLHRFGAEGGKEMCQFSPEALLALQQHAWPGNVRELENRVKRAVIMAEGKYLTPGDLELVQGPEPAVKLTLKEAREDLERRMLSQALLQHSGKVSAAAEDLGISRPTFYDLMDKLGLARP